MQKINCKYRGTELRVFSPLHPASPASFSIPLLYLIDAFNHSVQCKKRKEKPNQSLSNAGHIYFSVCFTHEKEVQNNLQKFKNKIRQ